LVGGIETQGLASLNFPTQITYQPKTKAYHLSAIYF
jgi:hypothetical protein